jgi:hypothetical protein
MEGRKKVVSESGELRTSTGTSTNGLPQTSRTSARPWAAATPLGSLRTSIALRLNHSIAPADATRAKHKLTRIVQMLFGLRRG